MAKTLCRNNRHPLTERTRKARGGTECSGCRREEVAYRNATRPMDADGSVDPSIFEDSRRWRASWAAAVDAAIARIRAEEGFNGRRYSWQTLGEYLLPEDPTPITTVVSRSAAPYPTRVGGRCADCGAPKREDVTCDFCATVLGRVAS